MPGAEAMADPMHSCTVGVYNHVGAVRVSERRKISRGLVDGLEGSGRPKRV